MLIVFIIIPICSNSQNIIKEWSIESEGNLWELASGMTIDKSGNICLCGNFNGELAVGGINLNGTQDIFISKFNNEGKLLFLTTYESDEYCHISTIASYNDNIYIAGYFQEELSIGDITLDAKGYIDGFFASIDTVGKVTWIKQISGDLGNTNFLIAPLHDNECIISSNFKNKIIVGDSVYSSSKKGSDIFLWRIGETGNVKNSRLIYGTGNEVINDLQIDELGRVFLVGSFEDTLNVKDIFLTSNGRRDGFIACLSFELNPIFSKQIGGKYEDYIQAIAFDTNNHFVIAGGYSCEMFLDKESIQMPHGGFDIFLCKYDENANLLWADNIGGNAHDYISSVAINQNNNIYISGSFRGEIEKNSQIIHSNQFTNYEFIGKYRPNGQFKYIELLGRQKANYSRKLNIDNDDFLYLSGNFSREVEPNTAKNNSYNENSVNIHLTKLFDCEYGESLTLGNDTAICDSSFTIKPDSVFTSYLWNNGYTGSSIKVDSTGFYWLTVKDDHGCISRDTIKIQISSPIDLEITGPDIVFKGEEFTLYTLEGMVNYLWSDNSTSSNLRVLPNELNVGDYVYSVQIRDTNQCIISASKKVQIIDLEHSPVDLPINQLTEYNTSVSDFLTMIFPNPTEDNCTLSIQSSTSIGQFSLFLYSDVGKLLWVKIYEEQRSCSEIEILTNALPPGKYFLMLYQHTRSIIKKIIVL